MERPVGGSRAARSTALAMMFGCVGLTLFAGWNFVTTPYSWASLPWAGGLVVGVVATPRVLRNLYIATVLSTWNRAGLVIDPTENRLWWLAQYMRASTLPYGLLAIAAVCGWRLSAGTHVPLYWPWCAVIIAVYALIALPAGGGIHAAPKMPFVRRFQLMRPWVLLVEAMAVALFVAVRFAGIKWLHLVLFVLVFFVLIFWVTVITNGAAQIFLRVDRGTSESIPLDWPWDRPRR